MMFPVERALLIINRTAGTGESESITEKLTLLFKQGLDELSTVQVELISDHAAARTCAAGFISQSEAPALIVAGGGGGTLRAVIEGICDSRTSADLPGPQRVRVGALRMGSGNVLAKQFGVPYDPEVALHGLLMNLKAGRTAPCCVMRCETWASSGNSEIHHAVTLGGFGLSRWVGAWVIVNPRYLGADLVGVETVALIEYSEIRRKLWATPHPVSQTFSDGFVRAAD